MNSPEPNLKPLTYGEVMQLSSAFVLLKDKEMSFKSALVISRNAIKLEDAAKPYRDAVEVAQKRFRAFKEENDKVEAGVVVKEAAELAFTRKLEDEINAEGGQPSTLLLSDLEPLPVGSLDDAKVKVSEIHYLVTKGLVS